MFVGIADITIVILKFVMKCIVIFVVVLYARPVLAQRKNTSKHILASRCDAFAIPIRVTLI